MSYPKFRIIDELLSDFWYKIGAQSYLGCVVPSQGSKLLSLKIIQIYNGYRENKTYKFSMFLDKS